MSACITLSVDVEITLKLLPLEVIGELAHRGLGPFGEVWNTLQKLYLCI
jgi:hypothetical protein